MAEETKDIQRTREASGDTLFLVQSSHVKSKTSSTEEADLLRSLIGKDWQFSEVTTEQYKPTMSSDKSPKDYDRFKVAMGRENILDDTRAFQNIRVSYEPLASNEIDVRFADQKRLYDNFNLMIEKKGSLTYQDHASRFNIYEKSSNKAEEAAGVLNLYMNVEKNYNFMMTDYETMLGDVEIREVDLPNFYSVMFANEEDRDKEYNFEKKRKPYSLQLSNICRANATLHGAIKIPTIAISSIDNINSVPKKKDYEYRLNDVSTIRYLSDYTVAVELFPKARIFGGVEKQRRTFFSKEETRRMNELSKYREMFPMYTRVRFKTEFESGFGTTLSETNYSSRIRDFVDTTTPMSMNTHEVISRVSENGYPTLNPMDPTSYDPPNSQVRRFYDVDEFFEKHFDNDPVDSFYFTGSDIDGSNQYRAYNSLMTVIAKAKIEKIKKEKFRTFSDIMNGKTCHTETVMYSLRKYDQSESLIQTFYFTNSKEIDEIDFIDTQVKYGKKYRYELSVVKLIVGTEYKYSITKIDPTATSYRVESAPSLRLVEISLVSDFSLIIDSMPLPPEFYPIPITNVNNRIKWFLNSSIGRHMLKPITFTTEEVERVEEQKIAQKIPPEQEKIMYESDDGVSDFEIYKLPYAPRTYEDFYMNGERIGARTSFEDGTVAVSSAHEDRVEPNKKYYYCARSIDDHGNKSNPTMVWEVELVSESGTCYPMFKEYDMKPSEDKVYKRSAKRFIQISPAHMQTIVNEAASNIGPEGPSLANNKNISLGVTESNIWGKKFKIRLTSRATGKKVDFNFSFKVKPKDEFLQS